MTAGRASALPAQSDKERDVKIKMTQQITGTRDGSPWPAPGGELVVPDAEGAELCAQGLAVPVAETPKPEKRKTRKTTAKTDS